MDRLNRTKLPSYPVRVMQFGEGNFMRAFVDWMINRLNQSTGFQGMVQVIQPLPNGLGEMLNEQGGMYNVISRGMEQGQVVDRIELIECVKGCLNPYTQWGEVIETALLPSLRFVFSNTTEAGIEYRPDADTFPSKVARVVTARAQAGLPGLVFIPCELIERNGEKLKECVLRYLTNPQVIDYVNNACIFCNTLVDRIVSGYPHAEVQKYWDRLGYQDNLLVCGEPFHFFVIEGPASVARELPFAEAGLNVLYTDDQTLYRTRKVRFLNGAHTASVLGASLAGFTFVDQMVRDPEYNAFLRGVLFDEVMPTVPLPEAEKKAYAESVLERFANPYAMHRLSSIALNSVSKWKVRVLPTLLDYRRQFGVLPERLTRSLAYLINYYRAREIQDSPEVKEFFAGQPSLEEILGHQDFWGMDLNRIEGFADQVRKDLSGGSARVIHPQDNVEIREDGHKYARQPLAAGAQVVKYGMPIGHARCGIAVGERVHVNNLQTNLQGRLEYAYTPDFLPVQIHCDREFMGYVRPDGQVGIRNDLWIVPTVGCINALAQSLARSCGGLALTHPFGCSQLGEDHAMTAKLLASLCHHPNAGGVLVIGLGCENNTLESFRGVLGDVSQLNIRFMIAQEEQDEYERGLALLEELKANLPPRRPVPAARLVVGLKCGGSDGFSGITANPLVGRFSDWLVAQGGTTVLTEVPEMFGAETLLMNRCVDRAVFDKCVAMINDFKAYYERHDQVIYENPSPGNKAGGISTLEDKSLGCVQKGGSSPVVDVLDYAERVRTPGLNLLTGPGNDLIASTVLAAAGCQLILFTTGRGTPFGTVVPTVKVSTNSALAAKKPHWIDFDAGRPLPMETLNAELVDYVLRLAAGEVKARNEEHGFQEIAIFKQGVIL